MKNYNYKFQVDQIFIFQEELFLRSVPKLGSDGQHSTLAYLLPEEDSNHENPTLKSEDTMVHKKILGVILDGQKGK